jgi:hypothetical protein
VPTSRLGTNRAKSNTSVGANFSHRRENPFKKTALRSCFYCRKQLCTPRKSSTNVHARQTGSYLTFPDGEGPSRPWKPSQVVELNRQVRHELLDFLRHFNTFWSRSCRMLFTNLQSLQGCVRRGRVAKVNSVPRTSSYVCSWNVWPRYFPALNCRPVASSVTRDRCNDFFNFAEKFSEKIGVFNSKTKLNYAKFWS